MAYFTEHIVSDDFASAFTIISEHLCKTETPTQTKPLGKWPGKVLVYRVNFDLVYLLKASNKIVAMVDTDGDGINLMRYVLGFDSKIVLSIHKFFADYCKEDANIFIYKP